MSESDTSALWANLIHGVQSLQRVQKVVVYCRNTQSRHCFSPDVWGRDLSLWLHTWYLMLKLYDGERFPLDVVCCFNCVFTRDFHRTVYGVTVLFHLLIIAVLFVCNSICLSVGYISQQHVIRSTLCLVLGSVFRGWRIERRHFWLDQIQDGGRRPSWKSLKRIIWFTLCMYSVHRPYFALEQSSPALSWQSLNYMGVADSQLVPGHSLYSQLNEIYHIYKVIDDLDVISADCNQWSRSAVMTSLAPSSLLSLLKEAEK